jgi:protein-disulfide isomerase
MEKTKSQHITLPGAIIVAGAIIAMAIIWSSSSKSTPTAQVPNLDQEVRIPDISTSDHILGSPTATIKIVEYSDPSCPYCKLFNEVMVQIMSEYGESGKVAWVYRAMPMDKPNGDGSILHPNAGRESQAIECAGSLGGEGKFWAYEKKLYEVTPSVTPSTPKGLDQAQLPVIAKSVGLDTVAFNECLTSGQFKDRVDSQYLSGVNAGINGTPYSFIIAPSGQQVPIIGYKPYAVIKSAIDSILKESK